MNAQPTKIALIDDDQNILTSVSIALEAEGFNVKTYMEGETAVKGLNDNPVDLVVSDIKMPRMNGMEVLTKIRESSEVPFIFLTSKDDEIDQVLGLRMGADDYITKPFSQRLLIERIRAILRRNEKRAAGNDNETDSPKIAHGHLELDEDRHLCLWKSDAVDLTVTEFLLIKALAIRPGHVKSRDSLMDIAYGDSIYVDDRTIDSHIKRIRKKFKQVDDTFDHIDTVYGVGYKYKE